MRKNRNMPPVIIPLGMPMVILAAVLTVVAIAAGIAYLFGWTGK